MRNGKKTLTGSARENRDVQGHALGRGPKSVSSPERAPTFGGRTTSSDLNDWEVVGGKYGAADFLICKRTWFDARALARIATGDDEADVRLYDPERKKKESKARSMPPPAPEIEIPKVSIARDVPADSERPRAKKKYPPCSAGHDSDLWCEYCQPTPGGE